MPKSAIEEAIIDWRLHEEEYIRSFQKTLLPGLWSYLITDSTMLEHFVKSDVIKSVIRNSTDLNAKDQYGLTLLHYAVLDENIDIMMVLLDNGANIDIENNDKETPLYLAFMNGKAESVKFLIEREAE